MPSSIVLPTSHYSDDSIYVYGSCTFDMADPTDVVLINNSEVKAVNWWYGLPNTPSGLPTETKQRLQNATSMTLWCKASFNSLEEQAIAQPYDDCAEIVLCVQPKVPVAAANLAAIIPETQPEEYGCGWLWSNNGATRPLTSMDLTYAYQQVMASVMTLMSSDSGIVGERAVFVRPGLVPGLSSPTVSILYEFVARLGFSAFPTSPEVLITDRCSMPPFIMQTPTVQSDYGNTFLFSQVDGGGPSPPLNLRSSTPGPKGWIPPTTPLYFPRRQMASGPRKFRRIVRMASGGREYLAGGVKTLIDPNNVISGYLFGGPWRVTASILQVGTPESMTGALVDISACDPTFVPDGVALDQHDGTAISLATPDYRMPETQRLDVTATSGNDLIVSISAQYP